MTIAPAVGTFAPVRAAAQPAALLISISRFRAGQLTVGKCPLSAGQDRSAETELPHQLVLTDNLVRVSFAHATGSPQVVFLRATDPKRATRGYRFFGRLSHAPARLWGN